MGQTYSVTAKLKFKNNDPSLFCDAIKEEIEKRNGKSAVFSLNGCDLDDPFGCFEAVTSKYSGKLPDGTWYSDFSGSYGWGQVMIDVFQEAAKSLANGSFITIEPWESDGTKITVDGGSVKTEWIE